jgi:hypothetical protein
MGVITPTPGSYGTLRRTWRNAGAPTDGVNGTYANIAEKGDLLIDSTNATLYQNTNTQASPTWSQISSGGVTLDGAYDYGGAGVGKAITADNGAVAISSTAADNNGILTLTKDPVGAQSGAGLTITMGAQCSGTGLAFVNTGSGNDLLGSGSTWSISKAGAVTITTIASTAHTLLEGADPGAGVASIFRDNTGDVNINALNAKSVQLSVNGTNVVTVAGAAVTIAQALTVSAGGAAITGNSTITGNLEVTGSLTFGGNWTVAATLTVDELILDTDGVAPAGTNVYLVRDNGGDGTLNVVAGKQAIIAVNNTDEYLFSSTIADFNDNALDNVGGYVIINAAVVPAGTEVYLGHDNAGDLTLNALTGKDILFAVNGVDEVSFGDTGAVFNEGSNDRDFRIETNGLQYAIYADGGKDSVVLGANADASSADKVVTISRAARSNTAAASFADLWIEPAGAITTTGVTAVVATVYIAEPNITIGGDSVTVAASLYLAGEPTEGGSNYGIACAASIGLLADAKDLAIGASADCLLRWSTADADNHALALGLGASLAFHICQAADIATDWNVAAAANPTLYIHGAATPATEYVAISTDETDAHLNAVGANWKFEIGGTPELTLAANALNLVDSILYGSAAEHTADTADGCLYLHSTSHATKGFVVIPNAQLGLVIGSDGSVDRAGTVGTNALHIFNGTAPAGALVNGVSLYSEGGECKVLDAAGNSTTLSPHTEDGDYVIHSYSAAKDETVTIHLEKLVKALAGSPELKKFVEVARGHSKRPVWAN